MCKKRVRVFAAAMLVIFCTALNHSPAASAWNGAINQTEDHSGEESMYKYTLELRVDDPCCTDSKDAVEEFWIDFDYLGENGYGAKKTYRFDMSWSSKDKRSLNDEILRKTFWRSNENSYSTTLDLWVPGLITEVRMHLNMDWEAVSVSVGGIWLNGYRVNTDTDYVESRILSSNAKIPCFVSCSQIVEPPQTAFAQDGVLYDQYGGILTAKNAANAQINADSGDYSMFYHYSGYSEKGSKQN